MTERTLEVLVVDDEERIRRLLKMYLEKENYEISEAENGEDALKMILENDYDVVLLDLMIPGIDGIEVAKRVREVKDTPIIMLTAKGEESSRVLGFEVGADDYIVKPFSPREVLLRVKALLRRYELSRPVPEENPELIEFEHLTIDNEAHKVLADGKEINLTPKEYDLLFFLAQSPGKIYGREQLLREVWKYEFFGDLRTVDTHVKRLREKLAQSSEESAKLIVTVWGLGYKFEAAE